MSKFNAQLSEHGAARTATGPVVAGKLDQRTGNGARAFSREAEGELFLLAVTNFVSEDTFYESGKARDTRFESLVHEVTEKNPAWMQAFIPWLRNEANMRSAALVAAAEYVKAGGPLGRQVVASAISRADEPSEVLAYWIARHGRSIPQPIKRGVADAAQRLYNERNVLKYDSNGAAVRMADVIQMAHVKPKADWQSTLFQYVLGGRYGNTEQMAEARKGLPMIDSNRRFREMDAATARATLLSDPEALAGAGMTWESLSSFGPMDKAAWEAIIPNMGFMALLRNLRNFDEAGVSDAVAQQIIAKFTDPKQVARSRQLPMRFWSAYTNAPSLRWSYALETALDLSCQNVPTFNGKTLVLVDTSGSMQGMNYSARSKSTPVQLAGLFGAVLAKRDPQNVRIVQFATGVQDIKVNPGESALKIQAKIQAQIGRVGHGTDVLRAVNEWKGEDRIIVLSDMQTTTEFTRSDVADRTDRYGYGYSRKSLVPSRVPVYGFNLDGYEATPLAAGDLKANEYEMGGLTDKTFQMIKLIEESKAAKWPWEQ